MRAEPVDLAVLEAEGHDAAALAVLHDQVESKVLDEEGAVVPHGLAVEGVQERVTGTISDSAAPVSLAALAEVVALTTESPLVDLTLLGTGERHTVVLELDNGGGGLATHVVDGILVTKPIATLDGVVRMPAPIIIVGIAKRGIDTTLGSDSVRSGGEQLGNASGLVALLGETEGSAEARTTGTDDDAIVGVINDIVRAGQSALRFTSLGGGVRNHGVVPSEEARRGGGPDARRSREGALESGRSGEARESH